MVQHSKCLPSGSPLSGKKWSQLKTMSDAHLLGFGDGPADLAIVGVLRLELNGDPDRVGHSDADTEQVSTMRWSTTRLQSLGSSAPASECLSVHRQLTVGAGALANDRPGMCRICSTTSNSTASWAVISIASSISSANGNQLATAEVD